MEALIERKNILKCDEKDNYLMFYVGEEKYCISINSITDIIENQEGMPINNLSKSFVYTINVEEDTIPVMDLRIRLDKRSKSNFSGNFIILIKVESILLGIIVDKLLGVNNIKKENIKKLMKCGNNNMDEIVKNAEKIMYILNIGKLIDIKDYEIIMNLESSRVLDYSDYI